jgi:2-polyprenyl-3-methyl-5-hydroxy-6-metoxy-1,4-benzoquinol methylase
MLNKSLRDLRLLDVGCSSGATVWIAQNMGLQAEGVEPMEQPIAKAKEMGLNVHHGLLHEIALPDNSFDVITLFEVVEHIEHPINLLNECHRILRPGGILVIGTGNTASWTQMIRGNAWDFFDMQQHGSHISFFNCQSITALAKNTGFGIEKIKTAGVKFFQREELPYLPYRLSKLLAEILNAPAILFKRGHQMEAYLVSTKKREGL